MGMHNCPHRFLLLLLVVAVGVTALSCNSRTLRRAARVAGEEAAYVALQSALTKAGVRSADHMTDAVRLVVDKNDYGGAAAAFAVALNEHNLKASEKLTSAQVIGLTRKSIPSVRSASPRVAAGLSGFCDYVASKGQRRRRTRDNSSRAGIEPARVSVGRRYLVSTTLVTRAPPEGSTK